MGSLQFQYPVWFLLLCILCGAGYAIAMYYRDRTFEDQRRSIKFLMGSLRFVTVTLIAILLLSPFLKYLSQTVQKPIIAIAHDNSSSVGDAFSPADSAKYVAALDRLVSDLGEVATVEQLSFGDEIRDGINLDFSEPLTDISMALTAISDRYADQNLGAVIVATDGLYNRGANPVYIPRRIQAPLHVVALGDTSVKTDLVVQKVLHNRISFLGDRFPIQVDISANKLNGRTASLVVERITNDRQQQLHSEQVRIDRDAFFETREILLEANDPGINRYRVRLSGISNEVQYANNLKDIYIEIIDGRIEVLILAHAPHPDIAAVRELVITNENYNVTSSLVEDFTGALTDFDLVVLHQLPSIAGTGANVMRQLANSDVPRLYILGSATSLPAFSQAQDLLTISGTQQSPNEVTAITNTGFQLFTIVENLDAQFRSFPPLYAPFGDYKAAPNVNVLFHQRIGNVETEYPLLLFGEDQGEKTAVLAAEGMWKWRLYDFLQNGNHELTGTLLNKVVQYLTVKDDRRKFRTAGSKSLFSDNENISISAELYNETYELINDPDAFLLVRDADGNEYSYTFNTTSTSYAIDIGKFPVGAYTYTAYTTFNGTRYEANGRFSVQEVQLEQYLTEADHGLLYSLADRYGGEVFYPEQLSAIPPALSDSDQLRDIVYQSAESQPLLSMKWLFFLILLLLGTEWFLRRYHGGY